MIFSLPRNISRDDTLDSVVCLNGLIPGIAVVTFVGA